MLGRARVGRDFFTRPLGDVLFGFQSTRPRGARPADHPLHVPFPYVSIHAPAWGATHNGDLRRSGIVVSIHAPAWGATASYAPLLPATVVSIHAPAWGATKLSKNGILFSTFQSTRPRGARPWARFPLPTANGFQSTRPRGARQVIASIAVVLPCFNPRARVGRDLSIWPNRPLITLFQSTRPRGARL